LKSKREIPPNKFSCKNIWRSCKNYYIWSHIKLWTMVKKCARYNIGLGKIATDKSGFLILVFFTLIVVSAGILLDLNLVQWGIVALSSSIFLFTGFYRSAAHILTRFDQSMSTGQAVRLKAMSNFMLTITAGISFFTYLIVFMPKINQLL
jgi:hypothetical protein